MVQSRSIRTIRRPRLFVVSHALKYDVARTLNLVVVG